LAVDTALQNQLHGGRLHTGRGLAQFIQEIGGRGLGWYQLVQVSEGKEMRLIVNYIRKAFVIQRVGYNRMADNQMLGSIGAGLLDNIGFANTPCALEKFGQPGNEGGA